MPDPSFIRQGLISDRATERIARARLRPDEVLHAATFDLARWGTRRVVTMATDQRLVQIRSRYWWPSDRGVIRDEPWPAEEGAPQDWSRHFRSPNGPGRDRVQPESRSYPHS